MITTQTKRITESTAGYCDIIDITPKLRKAIQSQNIRQGLIIGFASGSTAALATIEHESGLIQDLNEFQRWGDDNGFSHLRDPSSVHRSQFRLKMAGLFWKPGKR